MIINQLNCRESARENNIDFYFFFNKSAHRFVRQTNRDVKPHRIKHTNIKGKTTSLPTKCWYACIAVFIRKRNGVLSFSENFKEIFLQVAFNSYCLPLTQILHWNIVAGSGRKEIRGPLQKESTSGPVNKRCFTPHLREVTHWSSPVTIQLPPQVVIKHLASLQWLRGGLFLKWPHYTPGK